MSPIRMTLVAALALLVAGCAAGGGGRGPAAAFVAPDGATATPNTGASRIADGLATTASPGAGPAAPAPGGAAPAASADGVAFTYAGDGASVALAGEFNNWDPNADVMAKQADGSFRVVKKLAPGRYAYKFVVDGNWKPDPKASESVDDGFGGKNSIVVVGAGAAGGMAPAAPTTPAAPAAGPGTGRAPEIVAEGVRFSFGGAARTVHLAGDFNGWSPTSDPLERGADGTWTITRKLAAGSHAYKFVVDGTTWKMDEANPATVDDGFGGKNSIVVVP